MSLSLGNGSKPDGMFVKLGNPLSEPVFDSAGVRVVEEGWRSPGTIYLSVNGVEARITLEDFAQMVGYVMTNTDLEGPNDPRLQLLREIRMMHPVQGYGGETTFRLEISRPPGEHADCPVLDQLRPLLNSQN